jgi:hypothetical protein
MQLKVLIVEQRLIVFDGFYFVNFLAIRCNVVLYIVRGVGCLFKVEVFHLDLIGFQQLEIVNGANGLETCNG